MNSNLKPDRRLFTIGTGSGVAETGKGGPAYLVRVGATAFLLDCGEGAAGWLNHYDLTRDIGYIFITHMHADHVAGLYVLIQNMRLADRSAPLFIYMPESGIEPAKQMLAAMYLKQSHKAAGFAIQFRVVRAATLLQTDEFTLRAWASDHFGKDGLSKSLTRPAFGFTVETNHARLVYTGDVASLDCFRNELLPGTTLVCEAAHISSEAVLKTAERTGVKRVIFIHIDPIFTGSVVELCKQHNLAVIAKDGMEFEW